MTQYIKMRHIVYVILVQEYVEQDLRTEESERGSVINASPNKNKFMAYYFQITLQTFPFAE